MGFVVQAQMLQNAREPESRGSCDCCVSLSPGGAAEERRRRHAATVADGESRPSMLIHTNLSVTMSHTEPLIWEVSHTWRKSLTCGSILEERTIRPKLN